MSVMAINRAVETSTVRVEKPFPDYAAPRVWQWIQPFIKRVTDDSSPKTLEGFIEQWEELKAVRKTWGVWRGEELGGLISWEPSRFPETVISHVLFKKAFWGRSTTRVAMELAYGELFSNGTRRILLFPFRSNHAMRSLCKDMGARMKKVIRDPNVRQDGRPVDLVELSLSKEDFESCRG